MKKHLLSTSAIALGVAMASPAAAQSWDVGVGGSYNVRLGFSGLSGSADDAGGPLNGTDYEGVQIVKDAEIEIAPSITLDNGLTFGASIQYETADGSDMDEVYAYVSGDMLGTIEVGSENSAGAQMMVGMPSVGGTPVNSGSVSGFVPFATSAGGGAGVVNTAISFLGAGYSVYTEVGGGHFGNSDIPRVNYFTPSFNGLKVGVSYAPGTNPGGDGASGLVDYNAANELVDIFDIGVSYDQSFGTMDVSLAARYGTGDLNDPGFGVPAGQSVDPETWSFGGQVTSGAFTFGASYSENDNDLPGGVLDEEGFQIGAMYDIAGPWSAGIEYLHGEASHGTGNGEDELDVIKLAANRNLGPGVNWTTSLFYTEVDAADVATGGILNGRAGTDIEATTLATSISLSF